MQALQENDMRLSSVYEVDEPSVAFHSIADVCHVECPDGSTCFFDYNANVFACNAIVAAVGEDDLETETETEKEGKETSSEWPIADIPSTTARLNMHISTIAVDEEEEEVSNSTPTSGQVFDILSEESQMTTASTDDVGRGQDGITTTSERTGIVPASAEDEELSVVDIFPESGREDDSSSVDVVTLAMPESTTMPTSTVSGMTSTTVDPSPTDTSVLPESTDQPTEDLMAVPKTTQKQNVEVDQSPVPHGSGLVPDAVAPQSGIYSPTEANEVSVDSSTLSSLDETDIENEKQITVGEGATVAGSVPVETEGPLVTDGFIEDLTTASPMTTPTSIEFVQSPGDAEGAETEETFAVVTRGPETDFTTVAEPGFVITATSAANEQTEQTDVSTLRALIETTAESESKSGIFEGVTQGFESVNGVSEAVTEAQQRVEMTTLLSKVLTTTLQSITEGILRDRNLTDDSAAEELEDALTKALTEISTSTSTTATTEQITTSEEGSSSVDLSIPIIKDPAEVEQKLQELVANVTKQFKVTTLAYAEAEAAGVTESSISSALSEAVTMLVPGFVSTVATTEDPVPLLPATATVMGGAVAEDKLANETDNAAVPRNLQLDESEELHNALVTERTDALANECDALGMFSCGNGCIRRERRCDLIMDCEDGSDEIGCGEL